RGALLGVPLPLCSCAVIPAAVTLKKAGASNGATSSFLISTPETGVDSITLTYALMGLPMALLRPVAAFFSALAAGMLQWAFNSQPSTKSAPETLATKKDSCCDHNHGHDHLHAAEEGEGHAHLPEHRPSWKGAFRFAFVDLVDD